MVKIRPTAVTIMFSVLSNFHFSQRNPHLPPPPSSKVGANTPTNRRRPPTHFYTPPIRSTISSFGTNSPEPNLLTKNAPDSTKTEAHAEHCVYSTFQHRMTQKQPPCRCEMTGVKLRVSQLQLTELFAGLDLCLGKLGEIHHHQKVL